LVQPDLAAERAKQHVASLLKDGSWRLVSDQNTLIDAKIAQ
jgi:hypothetical protein